MMSPFRYWIALHPDIKKPIGGAKQIHRLAEAIALCGRDVHIIQDDHSFHPGWFNSSVNTISFHDWKQRYASFSPRRDIVILPETFLSHFTIYAPGLPKVIFNQNGSYTFGIPGNSTSSLHPEEVIKVYSHNEIIQVFCVSIHDESLLCDGLSLPRSRVSRLVNGIETNHFMPGPIKTRQIAYMPRKNFSHSQIVLSFLRRHPLLANWRFVPIAGCSQDQVVKILRESLIFLSFGHPEGFGLPVAEALACACAIVGYSGLGGKELFALSSESPLCREVAYGDWLGFVDGCLHISSLFESNKADFIHSLLNLSSHVRQSYSSDQMLTSVRDALAKCEKSVSDSFVD